MIAKRDARHIRTRFLIDGDPQKNAGRPLEYFERKKRTPWLAAAVVLGAAVVILFGYGGQPPDRTAIANPDETLDVGIFVDDAFGDGDFFDQAALATEPLTEDFGASVHTYEGQLQAQNFGPLLQDAADANDIVFVLGFEAIDAMTETAAANPDTHFAFLDGDAGSSHVTSAVFDTREGCFMAGALAATVNIENNAQTAGFIGGVNSPVVQNCESGYIDGVNEVGPSQNVAAQYVGSFVDPSKGSEIAISLSQTQGASAVFAYAGLSGTGAFDAAKSGVDLAPIGIVADKSFLAPSKVPGSLIMGVDTVILDIAQRVEQGEELRGETVSYGFSEGGWDMVYDNELIDARHLDDLKNLEKDIASGRTDIDE